MTKDEACAELIGLTDTGFSHDSQTMLAVTVLALVEECGADPMKLLASARKMLDRMAKQRTILQAQRAEQGMREAQRQAEIQRAFQEGRVYQEAQG